MHKHKMELDPWSEIRKQRKKAISFNLEPIIESEVSQKEKNK